MILGNMKEKIFKFLQEEKRVINTRTQEEYNELMEYFNYFRFIWASGLELTKGNNFSKNREETCIELEFDGENEIVWYSEYSYFLSNNYKVVNFSVFKERFINKDKHYQLHLAKQRVEQLEKEIKEEEIKKYYVRLKDIGNIILDKDKNYLNYHSGDGNFFFGDEQSNSDFKTKFTKEELIELNLWENDSVTIEEV